MSKEWRSRLARAANAGAVTLCASLIVLGMAVFVVSRLGATAHEAVRAHLLLKEAHTHVEELNGLRWRTIALGKSDPGLAGDVQRARSGMDGILEELHAIDRPAAIEVRDAFGVYMRAEDHLLGDSAFGWSRSAASTSSEQRSPAGLALHATVAQQMASSEAAASEADVLTTSGMTVTVLLSALAIVLLYRSFRSTRHEVELAEGRRKAIEESERRFKALVQNSADVIAVIDDSGTLTYISSTVKRVMGYDPHDLRGTSSFTYIHPEDVESSQDTLLELVVEPGAVAEVELRMRHADGSWRWVQVAGRNLIDDPTINGVLVNYRDVTDRKLLEEQLRDLAFRDALTNLANRTLFTDRVDHALARRDRTPSPISVLFLDVDDFKTINDSLGHACGDDLLAEVARRLQECIRPEDTIARFGGDEFAILLEDADTRAAQKVARRILEYIRKPIALGGRESVISISIGIADTTCSLNSDELLRNADVAMYMAKERGKSRHESFDPSMHDAAVKRMELKADLQHALDRQEFYLDYQPTVDLSTGDITGVEALARWRHPRHGLVSPAEFIPLAEESEVIFPLGRWVFEQACSQLRSWQEGRADRDSLTINVNLSARQLTSKSLREELAAVLAQTGISSRNLTLEITESLMMEDTEATIEAIQSLKSLGVRIAIDDFGTGYSALSYLRRFPIDVLKIDKEFVDEVTGGVEQSALVQAIIRLAKSFGLETVAEGIEEPGQIARLQELGCHVGQGFLLARPTSPEGIAAILEDGSMLKSKVDSSRPGASIPA